MRSLHPTRPTGFTLIEMLVATAIGAVLLSGLVSLARLGVMSRAQAREGAEAVYQVRFALERVVLAAQVSAPGTQLPPAANTSGTWFSPVYFCVNANRALIETTSSDTACTGTRVIADGVSSFVVSVPSGNGPLENVSAQVSVSAVGPQGGAALTLTRRLRFGGGEW